MSATDLGMPAFPDAARTAVRDAQLRHNLGRATETIRDRREAVVGELDDWQDLRASGAALKSHTLNNLDQYLEQFEEKVTAAGGVVHWARDADEANRIVVDLVRATGEPEVVKVKSMTTQETELGDALHDAGIDGWETDLAELIQDLTEQMKGAAAELQFEVAARLRDEIGDLKKELRQMLEATK